MRTHPSNIFWAMALAAVGACAWHGSGAVRCGAADRPNIIVFYTDDHGFADLSCQGVFGDLKTPHIDALAKSGVRFSNGYVTAPQCVPSRAGLLTGRSQNRFGVESNGVSLKGFDAELTIAERLQAAGYSTGMAGKWHLGPISKIVDHGFDDVYAKNSARAGWANFNLDGSDREGGPESTELYHLDANTEAACAFIRRHRDSPFFFYCAYRAPHVPLDAPPKYLGRFPGKMPERRRQALAMLSAVDDGVGKVVATLKSLELTERTLIFLIGDNGAPLKIHKADAPGGGPGWDGSLNDPFNGEKGMLSEGGIRVPFVAAWPGQIPAAVTFEHPVVSLDVAATAAAVAGIATRPGELDGANLTPAVQNNHPIARTLYWRWIAQSAVREDKWKYLRGGTREYLYDLEQDREEKRNLARERPDIVKRLHEKLSRWSQDLTPAGLHTKAMSATWESYFDYYLDGKPAPPLPTTQWTRPADDVVEGWVIRNGKAERQPDGLRVTQRTSGRVAEKQKALAPFLAQANLDIQGPAVITIQLGRRKRESPKDVRDVGVQVAWREKGDRDFPPENIAAAATVDGEAGVYRVRVDTPRRLIHLRVLLPAGTTTVRSIQVENGKTWSFRQTLPSRP